MNLTLSGGPHDGRRVWVDDPCPAVIALGAHSPTLALAGPVDPAEATEWQAQRWEVTFAVHTYSAATGHYLGVQG